MKKFVEAKHSEHEYRRISKKMDFNKSTLNNLPDVTKSVLIKKQDEMNVMMGYLQGLDLVTTNKTHRHMAVKQDGQLDMTFNSQSTVPRVGSQKRIFNANTESRSIHELENET